MTQRLLVAASAVCLAFLLLAIALEGTSASIGLNGSGDSVDVNGKEDSTGSLHEILASDAKSFLGQRTRTRVRRGWWEEMTGEDEEEREDRRARERTRETSEQNNEATTRRRCAPTCWSSWSAYSTCTDPCGNSGSQTATRRISPPSTCRSWVARYGCAGISSRTQACNRMCYNGGTPRDGWCSCTAWYQGSCCETRFCVESGTQLSSTGTCSLCPRGTYRDAPVHTRCESCPPGWTTLTSGARSQDQCTVRNCIQHGTELNEADDCQNCSIGYFRNASVHSACVPCPRHWTSASMGSSSKTNCSILHCDAGHEGLPVHGTCTECAVGYYKSYPGAGLCTPCPSGHITSRNGSTSERDCFDDSPQTLTSQVVKIEVISGGGVAGLIVLVTVVVAAVCIRKRWRKQDKPKGNTGSTGDSYDEIDTRRMNGIEDYDDGIERHKVSKYENVYAIFTGVENEDTAGKGQTDDGVPNKKVTLAPAVKPTGKAFVLNELTAGPYGNSSEL